MSLPRGVHIRASDFGNSHIDAATSNFPARKTKFSEEGFGHELQRTEYKPLAGNLVCHRNP